MLWLFVLFFLFLLIGMPIGFNLFVSSILYMWIFQIPFVGAIRALFEGVDSFPLLAVSFFILAGNIMNRGGITTRIFDFVGSLVGHKTGGMAHANVLASVIFSGMSGSAIADTGGLGAVELKAMKQAKYDEDFSLAVTGASSIIGPIIPPSVPAIIFAVSANASIGRLFIGGIVPGIVLAVMMCVLNYIFCLKNQYEKPQKATLSEVWQMFVKAFFPLLTPAIILFGIITGIYTPTEAAMIAVVYALILSICFGDFHFRELPRLLKETLGTTVGVLFIIASANLFAWLLIISQVPQELATFLVGLTENKYLILFIVNIFVLIVGCFLDLTPAILILTPIFVPIITQYGIDITHFGIIFILNLMIGLLTPPVGMILFVLSGVSKVPIERIAKAVGPYLIGCILILFIITYIPGLVTWLPNMLFSN